MQPHLIAAMSSTLPELAQPADTLESLRAELDRLDDGLHDMLMARAEVVTRVAALGAKGPVALRPGREADIIRRLLRRHKGALPKRVIPRIWRELLAATTAMQGPYAITVCEVPRASGTDAYAALTREHFGTGTPMRVHRSPAQAIAEVSAGTAIAAVLPMPSEEDDGRAAWWTALLQRDTPRIHVVARLPFWSPRAEGAPQVRALVVSTATPDQSQHDHTLIGLELSPEMSRARLSTALAEAGFTTSGILLRRAEHDPRSLLLIDVDGYVTEDDPRLAMLGTLRPPVVLGAYAMPVDGETP
jgi:chorismate mutase